MAEFSLPWAGIVTGDAGPYSDDDWSDIWRKIFTTDRTSEGVIGDYANELIVAGAASPVSVSTGAGLCDGKFYENDNVVNIVIPTPTVDTRIDRIVLRKSWVAQTVRLTRIEGVEGAGAPALTQIDGTTWDIPLYQVSIVIVTGAITLTDERTFCIAPIGTLFVDSSPELSATLDCLDNNIDNVGELEFNDGGSAVDIIRNEDDMVSDDDEALATQQSIRAYADTKAVIETGSYTGDGTLDQTITLADPLLNVKHIRIYIRQTLAAQASYYWESSDVMIDDNVEGMCMIGFGGTYSSYTNGIIALGVGEFHVDDAGTDGAPNTNGGVYNYTVWGTH